MKYWMRNTIWVLLLSLGPLSADGSTSKQNIGEILKLPPNSKGRIYCQRMIDSTPDDYAVNYECEIMGTKRTQFVTGKKAEALWRSVPKAKITENNEVCLRMGEKHFDYFCVQGLVGSTCKTIDRKTSPPKNK